MSIISTVQGWLGMKTDENRRRYTMGIVVKDVVASQAYFDEEGFHTGIATCLCGHKWNAALEDIEARNRLECPKCHKRNGMLEKAKWI